MRVPPAMWLSGFGFTIVQLLIKIGAAARAVPADAVIAATPTSATAIERPKLIMRISSPTGIEVSRRGLSLLLESFPSFGRAAGKRAPRHSCTQAAHVSSFFALLNVHQPR